MQSFLSGVQASLHSCHDADGYEHGRNTDCTLGLDLLSAAYLRSLLCIHNSQN